MPQLRQYRSYRLTLATNGSLEAGQGMPEVPITNNRVWCDTIQTDKILPCTITHKSRMPQFDLKFMVM